MAHIAHHDTETNTVTIWGNLTNGTRDIRRCALAEMQRRNDSRPLGRGKRGALIFDGALIPGVDVYRYPIGRA